MSNTTALHTFISHGPEQSGDQTLNHLDEQSVIVTERMFDKRPGVKTANVITYNPQIHGKGTEEEWEAHGFRFVGVGGREDRSIRRDDHPHGKHPHDCAFTLSLKILGLWGDPAWQWIGKQVLHEDRNGAAFLDHLALVVKKVARFYPQQVVEELVRSCLMALHYYYKKTNGGPEAYDVGVGLRLSVLEHALRTCNDVETVNTLLGAVQDAEEKAQASFLQAVKWIRHSLECKDGNVQVYDVPNPLFGKDPLRLVYMVGVGQDLPAAARSAQTFSDERGADLVVKVEPCSPNPPMLYMSASERTLILVDPLVAKWRQLEQELDSSLPRITSRKQLACDGMLHRFYHQKDARRGFSGTHTHPYEPRMRLPQERPESLKRYAVTLLAQGTPMSQEEWEERQARKRGLSA